MKDYKKEKIKNNNMKKYIINYVQSLGSFLDEQNINWESLPNDRIKIYCKNENELFRIAMKFQNFLIEIEQV